MNFAKFLRISFLTSLTAASASATHINADLPFQYNHLEQKVSKNFDWVNLNGCIADVDIKESTCRGKKTKGVRRLKKGVKKDVFQNI